MWGCESLAGSFCPALPAWLFWDASSLLPRSPPREWLLFPPTGKGSLGSEPELCSWLGDALGILWDVKFASVTALRPGKHQLRPECFCPGCLLSLQERQRETAPSGSCVVRNSARSASLLAQQQCWMRKGSPVVTGK